MTVKIGIGLAEHWVGGIFMARVATTGDAPADGRLPQPSERERELEALIERAKRQPGVYDLIEVQTAAERVFADSTGQPFIWTVASSTSR